MISYGKLKTMKKNVLLIPHLSLHLQNDFQQDIGHSSDLDQKQSGILLTKKDLEENGTKSLKIDDDQIWRKRTPVFRATSPLSRGVLKSKGGGKLSIHFCADEGTIETVFRTITSVNQLSLYGAVAEMCEEYESFHDRTEKPVVGGPSSSSFVPSVITLDNGKTPEKKEYHLVQNSLEEMHREAFQRIHNRFSRDPDFRKSMLEHDRDEEVSIKWDDLAEQGFSQNMTESEYFRYKRKWWISLKESGDTGPLRKRSDFNEALSALNRLHQASGERPLRPLPCWKYQERHPSSSSSSTWWQWSGSWWST